MVQDGIETKIETFQDAARDLIARHGADSPQVQEFAKWETRMRGLDVPFRNAQRFIAVDVFPSPSQTGLSPDDHDLLIRWVSNELNRTRYRKPGALVHNLTHIAYFAQHGMPMGEYTDAEMFRRLVLEEFRERRDEIAAHIDGWDWDALNRLPN